MQRPLTSLVLVALAAHAAPEATRRVLMGAAQLPLAALRELAPSLLPPTLVAMPVDEQEPLVLGELEE